MQSGGPPAQHIRNPDEVVRQAERLVRRGAEAGITMRVAGSTGIRMRCRRFTPFLDRNGRRLKDIDLVIPKKDVRGTRHTLADMDFTVHRETLIAFEGRRLLFTSRDGDLPVDVFVDEMAFCHRVDLRRRLPPYEPTLAPADLLLTKLQIVDLSPGDRYDILALFLEFDLSEDDTHGINAPYIARLLAADWGFWYTVTTNLQRLKTFDGGPGYLDPGERERATEGINALLAAIDREPRSIRWKMRARVGTRKAWYNRVDEP